MVGSVVGLVKDIKDTVVQLAPSISIILIVGAAIIYGVAHTQPAENRGKWQALAWGMFIGGCIIAAVWGAQDVIFSAMTTVLK